MNNQNIPTHDGWNHRWGCPPITIPKIKKNNTINNCTCCDNYLRVKIHNGTIEEYGNYTTKYGGKFCSSSCAITYIEKIEMNNKEKILVNNKNDDENTTNETKQ